MDRTDREFFDIVSDCTALRRRAGLLCARHRLRCVARRSVSALVTGLAGVAAVAPFSWDVDYTWTAAHV